MMQNSFTQELAHRRAGHLLVDKIFFRKNTWRVTNGGWRVNDGGWWATNGDQREIDGGWRVTIWTYGLHQTLKNKLLVRQQSSK